MPARILAVSISPFVTSNTTAWPSAKNAATESPHAHVVHKSLATCRTEPPSEVPRIVECPCRRAANVRRRRGTATRRVRRAHCQRAALLGSLPWSSLYAPTCRAESASSKPPRATRQPDHRSQVGSNESALPTPRPLGARPLRACTGTVPLRPAPEPRSDCSRPADAILTGRPLPMATRVSSSCMSR